MGQVRSVDVHRLLAEDTVDQRMLDILATKAVLCGGVADMGAGCVILTVGPAVAAVLGWAVTRSLILL
jgi:hypothetical protein